MSMIDASGGLGVNTHVSAPGGPTVGGVPAVSAAPGATAPGGNMSVSTAILWVIGGAAAALVALAIVFRKPIGEG